MVDVREGQAWRALEQQAQLLRADLARGYAMRRWFQEDPLRFQNMQLRLGDLLYDPSKQLVTPEVSRLLNALGEERCLGPAMEAMVEGAPINLTEGRAVLHTALRDRRGGPRRVGGQDVMPEVGAVLAQMREFVTALRSGAWRGATGLPIRDVVNIGIGGSDLGPAMATAALRPYWQAGLRVHYVSNVDGAHLQGTLADLSPETTLFIVASKTFTTQETLANAHSARAWLVGALGLEAVARHFVALSTNAKAVSDFGIDVRQMFAFWDWVGGRYSLWSAIGLSVACAIGMDAFEDLLQGAHEADRHALEAPIAANIPAQMALVGVWNRNFLGFPSLAVLPYDQSLHRLPAYLQQADMESNGKATTRDGGKTQWLTGPIVFGEPGTNGQHAFYQLLHQGSDIVPADFILVAHSAFATAPNHPIGDHHELLLSNGLAQTEALMRGKTEAEVMLELRLAGIVGADAAALAPHKIFSGDRPTTTLLMDRLTPHALGRLIAIYEHKIFFQGILWDICSFDQWGVELGKQLAKAIGPELRGAAPGNHDASTSGLIAELRQRRGA